MLTPQELGVYRHDYGAERHQDCPDRGREQNSLAGQNAGSQWNGHDIVSRGPPEVLDHLSSPFTLRRTADAPTRDDGIGLAKPVIV